MPRPKHPALAKAAAVGLPILRLLPVRAASELTAFVVSRYSQVFVKSRTMRRNLAHAFPELDEPALDDLVSRNVGNLGRLVAEVAHIPTFAAGRQRTAITTEGATEYVTGKDVQAIFVGAHLGNWELIPILFQRAAHPLTIIYSQIGVETIDRRLLSLRQQTGASYVEKSEALRASLRAMRQGESLALLIDQRVDRGVEVEFFGERSHFSSIPAGMAFRFACPVIVVEAFRVGCGRVHAIFHPPIWPEKERGADAEHRMTQRIATVIEDGIRRHPEQWFCNKRRWKKNL